MIKMNEIIEEDLADEGVFSGVEKEDTSDDCYINTEPFEPSSISISTKPIALDYVLRRIKNNTIILAPDFQRDFVWDKKRKSQLIESMILRIPLPMFYVAEDSKGNWEVVDGLQRLSTIRDFILGPDGDGKGDKLTGLEFVKILENKDFFSIEKDDKAIRFVNNIMETSLSFTIITPDTPEKVKRNVFKRLNTGGMRLSDQEIRHALYQGDSTRIIKKCVLSEEYKLATNESVKDNRMTGRELVLRYFAFNLLGRNSFKAPASMDDFLSEAMIFMNNEKKDTQKDAKIKKAENSFLLGLIRSRKLFGDHAFRTSTSRDFRKTPINKALFEVWINILSDLSESHFDILASKSECFFNKYIELLKTDEFTNSISRHGGSPVGSTTRFNKLIALVKNIIEDQNA